MCHLDDESRSSVSPMRQRVQLSVKRRQILTDVNSVDRYYFSLATTSRIWQPFSSVYLKAKTAEPWPHLLASLAAMNAYIIRLSPCKPRTASSCAKSSPALPLSKTTTRLRNSLCCNHFFHGNFAYLYSSKESSQPLSCCTHTTTPFTSQSISVQCYNTVGLPFTIVWL